MTKDEMLSLVILSFGFEHEVTIQFAQAMENLKQSELEALLYKILDLPLTDEDF